MEQEEIKYGYTQVSDGDFGGEIGNDEKLYGKFMALFDEFKHGSEWIRGKWERNRRLFLAQGLGIPLGRELHREDFGPLNQQDCRRERKPMTSTPILYSTYENLCSDAIEMKPEAVFLGRSQDDGALADDMTAIFRCLLDRRNFKATYAEWVRVRSQFGMAIVETLWDDTLDGRQGDVDLTVWQPDDIWLDPLYENLQDGRAIFKVTYHHPSWFKEHYPDRIQYMHEVSGEMQDDDAGRYIPDKATSTMPLYEVWCRRWDAKKKRYTVHMYKLAGGAVLENSELKPETAGGMYAHGEYPFVASYYERIPGTPWGMGPMDYLGPVQEYISQMDDLILQNIKASAKPRVYYSQASGIDPVQLADMDEQFIEISGANLDCVKWESGQPLSPLALQMYASKTDTLKTESGQNAASRGEVPGSVTAASAISMLQSAGSKRANLSQYNLNNSFAQVVRQMVSCMMQFYTAARVFRQRGVLVETDRTYTFDPAVYRGKDHEWQYDLDVRIQRESTFQTAYTNQTVLSFLQMGAIDASDAILLLDIPNKDAIRLAVDKNNRIKETLQGLMQQVQQLRQQGQAAQAENEQLLQAAQEPAGEVDMSGNSMFAEAETAWQ